MEHMLDNPIYYSLTTSHQQYANGTDTVRYYQDDICRFIGLKNNSLQELITLGEISAVNSQFVFFAINPIQIPSIWELSNHIDMYQMVYRGSGIADHNTTEIVNLERADVPLMLELVELTKPGPFLTNTIELGNYTGIFREEKLVSMAGHRFYLQPYREISAVCTHPDYLGNGFAFHILQEQISRILKRSEIPFLHVRADNMGAIKLYQKLGFQIRTEMTAYILKKGD